VSNLPYYVPDKDFELNVAVLLLIISGLSKTKRGKATLNNEKVSIFMYLVHSPSVLNKLIRVFDKEEMILSESESYSIESLSVNVDFLFNREKVQLLLKALVVKDYLEVEYRKSEGFMYHLSSAGHQAVPALKGEYFDRIRKYTVSMKYLQTCSAASLNKSLSTIFNERNA